MEIQESIPKIQINKFTLLKSVSYDFIKQKWPLIIKWTIFGIFVAGLITGLLYLANSCERCSMITLFILVLGIFFIVIFISIFFKYKKRFSELENTLSEIS